MSAPDIKKQTVPVFKRSEIRAMSAFAVSVAPALAESGFIVIVEDVPGAIPHAD